MRERRTARVLLLGPSGRLLLIRFEDRRADGPHVFWATVGGEIEAGESPAQAAARETWEETGLTSVEVGPVVWTHEHVLALGGEDVLFKECFLLARCADEIISGADMTDGERSIIRGSRWWTLHEIAASQETIYPPGLARLLGSILAGELPEAPLRLGESEHD